MGKSVYIAEKPSVAQEFAKALKLNTKRRDGYLESDEAIVTWCVGHLVTMSYPEEYDPALKKWNLQTLPFPAHWFSLAATGFLEVTNGVALLSTSACTRQIKSLLAVLFLSWGGLSGIFQVSSILHQTGLSLRNYVLQKIILLLLTVGCCIPLLFLGILI